MRLIRPCSGSLISGLDFNIDKANWLPEALSTKDRKEFGSAAGLWGRPFAAASVHLRTTRTSGKGIEYIFQGFLFVGTRRPLPPKVKLDCHPCSIQPSPHHPCTLSIMSLLFHHRLQKYEPLMSMIRRWLVIALLLIRIIGILIMNRQSLVSLMRNGPVCMNHITTTVSFVTNNEESSQKKGFLRSPQDLIVTNAE
jgi:hypothetical protein